MKVKLSIEGCYYEDWETISQLLKSKEYLIALHDVFNLARQQLKHGLAERDRMIIEQILEIAEISQE